MTKTILFIFYVFNADDGTPVRAFDTLKDCLAFEAKATVIVDSSDFTGCYTETHK